MISVLVVNLNNLEYTKNCISDLLCQDSEFKLTVLDQNSSEDGSGEYFLSLPSHIEFIQNYRNQPLNHIWNWFVERSDTPYICLLNNDVRISPNFLSSALEVFEKEPNVGFVNHVTNNNNYRTRWDKLEYRIIDFPYRQGWDPIFRKECYSPIPEDLLFFYGDDYIYSKLYSSGMKGAYVLNSPMIHFERSTTTEKGGQRDASIDNSFFYALELEYKDLSFVEELSKWKPEFMEFNDTKYSKENYITRDANIESWETHLNSIILKQYSHLIKGTVADFGCNHGSCTIISARNPHVKNIIGIDINKESILTAENLLDRCEESDEIKNKVRYQVANFTNLNRISDNFFDSATCFHTLEHIYPEDYSQVFSEWKRVIKDGGYFIVSVPYLKAYDDPCHVNYFDENNLPLIFTENGIEVIECYRDNREGFDCLNMISRINKKEIELSILICSLTERNSLFLDRLLGRLNPQIENKNVELLVISDNAKRSIGKKRNDAIQMASGKYVCFVDDDDLVSDDYVDSILKEIREWCPDVIVFDAMITFNGQNPKLVRYGREFDYCEKDDAYYRHPNHLMVHKKSNILEWFKDVKTGEDDEWAARMLSRIVTQSRIEKVLYYYDYRTTTKKYYQ
jgi:GT2 family glycosyltransferase/ubiquinone/menaquinone biosynthesis C-methylase UbiE